MNILVVSFSVISAISNIQSQRASHTKLTNTHKTHRHTRPTSSQWPPPTTHHVSLSLLRHAWLPNPPPQRASSPKCIWAAPEPPWVPPLPARRRSPRVRHPLRYNTLLSLYGKLGRFEEALSVCKEMESVGILKDAVWEVRELYDEMKAVRVSPNLLTYSTLIDVYSKGSLYAEAMNEFKQAGLKADVVLYSELINALCKNGLVESAVSLLDEMTKEGIRPNVVTYNSIIDAFGRPATTECAVDAGTRGIVLHDESSTSLSATEFDISADNVQNLVRDREDTRIMKMFGWLAADKASYAKKDMKVRQEILCILAVFQKMHELEIKPNVVTFSAILNACSRCNSFEDASMLLEELRLFDNQVYGVAHGLMGYPGNVWVKAQSLFDEVKQMNCSTASAFYNALTDMLWHFGQKKGAQLVVLEGKRRNVWENAWSNSRLDLHLMSSGAARAMVHAWLLNIHSIVYQGQQLPNLLSILTGWGKHSKVVGDSALRRAVEALLTSMGAPFRVHECNIGRFISSGSVAAACLVERIWHTGGAHASR